MSPEFKNVLADLSSELADLKLEAATLKEQIAVLQEENALLKKTTQPPDEKPVARKWGVTSSKEMMASTVQPVGTRNERSRLPLALMQNFDFVPYAKLHWEQANNLFKLTHDGAV